MSDNPFPHPTSKARNLADPSTIYNPTVPEAMRRGWDWVIFTVRLFSRVGGPKAWYRAFQRLILLLFSRSRPSAIAQLQPEILHSKLTQALQPSFFETAHFLFVQHLEGNWQFIQEELQNLGPNDFIPWSERYLYKEGWTTFGRYAFGIKIEKNCQLCPESTRLIETIPKLVTAGFSSLAPETHIAPHTGYPDGVLRCHLGLVVPPDCGIRVGDDVRHWIEGQCLIFDDTLEHEAWNRSRETRIVLLIDFQAPLNHSA